MSNYSKTTDFEAKDSLPTGDSGKIIRGAEFETEFDAISTAIATKADTAGPTFTGTLTFETISDGTIAVTAFVDEDDMVSDSATLVPTQQSVKAYVDSVTTELEAQDLDFQADSGGALSIDLDSETLTFTGGTGIDTSGSGNAVTFAIDSTVTTLTGTQTLTNKTLTAPTISGDLTTDGTIDGRDVAADGTKLDGIESGATADQTAAEIRTLVDSATDSNVFTDADHTKLDGIEANATADQTAAEIRTLVEAATDSNVFTDADHTKLDGIEAGADVTDTTNVTAAGAVMDSELTNETAVKSLDQGVATTDTPTFAGLTTTADVSFGDNDKAIFGAGSDLQIYHDGSNSFIDDQGTGSLVLQSNGAFTVIQNSSGVANARFDSAGAASLRYNGAEKLATTSTGIDVTGTVVADGLTVDGGTTLNTSSTVFANLNYSGSNLGKLGTDGINVNLEANSNLFLKANSATRAKFDGNGDISFYEDTGTTAKLFWDASAESLTVGSGSTANPAAPLIVSNDETGGFSAKLTSSNFNSDGNWLGLGLGYNNNYMKAALIAEAKDNNARANLHFALDSDIGSGNVGLSDAKMTIDYAGNVGIGTSSPSDSLEVAGNVASAHRIRINNANASGAETLSFTQGSTFKSWIEFDNSTSNFDVWQYTNNALRFGTNNTERMRIDSSGNLLVGKTSSDISTNGFEATSSGITRITRTSATANTNPALIINRKSSDGPIVDLKKDGSTVGSIASVGGSDIKVVFSSDGDQYITGNATSNYLTFSSANAERMRLDSSGNLLVGGTSITADEGGIALIPQASNVSHMYIGHATGTATGNPYIYFRYGSSNIGSITQSGTTAVLYNTSSDQRLKDNIVDAPSASDDIDAIQVRSFDWKADGSHQKYGMVAQELQSVAPEAVTGDADSDDMMGVDYSKLVPMMIKEIQSLRARVAQLEGEN